MLYLADSGRRRPWREVAWRFGGRATRRAALLAILAVALVGCGWPNGRASPTTAGPTPGAPAASSPRAGDFTADITSSGKTRHYLLHLATDYRAGESLPLVVNLHGLGSNGVQTEALSGMSAKADQARFVVVYPEALGDPATWRVGPGEGAREDVQLVRDIIARLESELSVDPARVYVAGISNGGGMASRVGCDLADRVAAIASVSGAYLFSESCQPARPVPVIAFHGTADRIVPYEGMGRSLPPVRDWAAGWANRDDCAASPAVILRQNGVVGETWSGCRAGALVVLYTIDGGGHTWPRSSGLLAGREGKLDATDLIWDFFAKHPLTGA